MTATTSPPALSVLSLGAGVQSTTVLMLAADGVLPRIDAAIFADTGWEPRAVYDHLDRLDREVAGPAGIPIHRVSQSNLRDDVLDASGATHFASMPLFILGPATTVPVTAVCPRCHGDVDERQMCGCDGRGTVPTGDMRPATRDERFGMLRRQCTKDYKVRPIKTRVREMLGCPHPTPIPRGTVVDQWIGISRDEFGRAKDADVAFMRNVFPLIGKGVDADPPLVGADGLAGWTRADCIRYLTDHGFPQTPKSACVGCPYHGNAAWRRMRDDHPDEWADAVEFDAALRASSVYSDGPRALRGEAYLHRSRVPLADAPIDRVTPREWTDRQTDMFDAIADVNRAEDDVIGCSPFECRGDDDTEGVLVDGVPDR